ncbi:CaiB/BaiF CoA-transferase family protein [Rhodococcoides yunnanense]|uniref:CaiB/BaiF CoA-transferase family protein n=1 Tax=Rhodococcoides yunnanense TaxID=278209 RepID=UPI001476085E|nr:CoA transferase [Rhodococcus yunnanensis]
MNTTSKPPLDGVRVVDLTDSIGGMTATMLLADLGADVVRFGDSEDRLAGEVMWHRNKRVQPRSPEAERAAIDACDVVVTTDDAQSDAFASVIDSSGVVHLDMPTLLPEASADAQVYESMLCAWAGLSTRQSSYTGGPIELVVPFVSYAQGVWAAAALVAALVERQRSGRGQCVTVDARHGALIAATTTSLLDPEAPAPNTAVGPHGPTPNYSPYRCSDGEWVFLAALSGKFMKSAFAALGIPQILEDPRIAHNDANFYLPANQGWTRAMIAEAFLAHDRDHWLETLQRADVPCGPLGEPEQWLDQPQLGAIGQRVELDDPRQGPSVTAGSPVTFARTPLAPFRARRFEQSTEWEHLDSVSTSDEAPSDGPLAGVRILNLGTVVAGPFAGRLLAGLGAEVVKVEPPAGDSFRPRGHIYNRGNESLAIDLRKDEGHRAFLRVVETADVVLDNYRPGVLQKLGIDHAALELVNSRIITASITGFGGIGPLGTDPGFDPVLQAMSGMMSVQGGADEPIFHTVAANDLGAGAALALGVCAALFARERQGVSQNVSTSLAAVSAYMLNGELVKFADRSPVSRGGRDFRGATPLSRFYETADSGTWIRLHVESAETLVRAGIIDAIPDEGDDVAELLALSIGKLTAETAISRIHEAGGLARVARTTADVANDPNSVSGKYFIPVTRPDGKVLLFPSHYARFSRTERSSELAMAGVGEQSRSLLTDAGLLGAEIDRLCDEGVVVDGGRVGKIEIAAYR